MTLSEIFKKKCIKQNKIAELLNYDKSNFSKKVKKNSLTINEMILLRNSGILSLEDLDNLTMYK